MPPVPELPSFDAKAANNAWRTIRKPDGSEYQVFGSESFVKFVQGLRTQQDYVEGHELRIVDLDTRLSALDTRETTRHAAVDARLDALEAAHRPFGSGSG